MPARKPHTGLLSAAPVFAALGDETRLRLVVRLSASEPLSITELASGTGVTRQAITKHLHVLAGVGLLRGSRSGREQRWQLERRQIQEARRCLDAISNEWDQALGRLKAQLERGT